MRIQSHLGFVFVLLTLCMMCWGATQSVAATIESASDRASRSILVRFKNDVRTAEVNAVSTSLGARVAYSFHIVDNLHLLELPSVEARSRALAELARSSSVLYAEPDYLRLALETIPNDPSFSALWALKQASDRDIDATDAWDITQGDSSVVVGVIDTGIYYPHEDLGENMWVNQAEATGQPGADDDGNGYVDDIYGIDAIGIDSDPIDTSDCEHGTHVTGTIGAVGNNGKGVVGVNWRVKLMALRVMEYITALGGCGGPDSGFLRCLEYTIDMKRRGVNVVATNNSWGGPYYGRALYDAIEANLREGILFVAAAGNDGWDNDTYPSYPADYQLPNVVSVAASTSTDTMASFSEYGRHTVHLGAPGVNITSTTVSPAYEGGWNGTSMAAPHVTGTIALLKAQNPGRDWKALKNLVLAGVEPMPAFANTIAGGRLNAHLSMTCSGRRISGRLRPTTSMMTCAPGENITLSMLSIDCDRPDDQGGLTVTVPGGVISLSDDGRGGGPGIWRRHLQCALAGTTRAWDVRNRLSRR